MEKRRLRKILVFVGAPLALILLIVLLADTGWVKRRLLAAADEKLRSEFGISLNAANSTLRLAGLSVSLRDVRLKPVPDGSRSGWAFSASEIYVNLGWSTIFTGNLRIREVRIVRPRFETSLPAGAGPPPPVVDALQPKPGPGKPFSFEIDKLSVIDGVLAFGGTDRTFGLGLEDFHVDLHRLPASVDHRGALRSRGGRFSLSGRPLEFRTIEADFVLDEQRIEVERIFVSTALSSLDVKGRIGDYQSVPSFDLAVSSDLALEEISRLFPELPGIHGLLAIKGTFKGTLAAARAAAVVQTENLIVDGYPEATLRLSVESDLRSLSMTELTVTAAGARLEGRGLIQPAGGGASRLDLSWASLDLSRFPAFIPGFPALDSVSQGNMTAAWTELRFDEVRASGEASFRSTGSRAANARSAFPFDGDLTFAASRDGIDFAPADVRAAGAEISLAGRMRWDGSFQSKIRAVFPDLAAASAAVSLLAGPLDGFPNLLGRARLEGTIEGTFAEPILRAELIAEGLSVNRLTVDSLEAAFSLDDRFRVLDISRFKATLASGTLEGRFALRPGSLFDASVRGAGLDLADLAPFLPDTALSGRVAFEAEGRGLLKKPELTLRLDGRNVGVPGIRIPVLVLSGESDGTLAQAKLTLGLIPDAPAPLTVDVELPLSSPYPVKATLRIEKLIIGNFIEASERRPEFLPTPLTGQGSFFAALEDLASSKADLTFTGIDLGSLAALAGLTLPPDVGGTADARIRASGDPTNLASLTAEGEFDRFVFSGNLPALESTGAVRFSLGNGDFELKECAFAIGDSFLRASGFVRNLAAEPEIAARISLDLDASLLPRGLVDAAVGGRLKLDFSVDGPMLKPVIRGEGGLSNGFFQAKDFPLILSDLSLRFELRDRSILITDGKGLANGGLLGLSGRVEFGEGLVIARAVFEADLEAFRLNYPTGLITLSDGNATLEGDGKTWLLAGNLKILQGSFREDVFPGAELFGFSSLPLPASGEASSAGGNFRLNISAATVEPIIVRNNMADFSLEADVRISGTLAVPIITGRVRNVAVGEIVFGERRYTLETLRIEFLGKPVPDPEIEITAFTRMSHRLEDLEIQLRVSGPASDLKFSLTSTPQRSSQDLSLLLLTGKSLDEVRGVTLDALKGQMVLYFASPLFAPLTRSLEKFLNVDNITFAPLSIASEEDPGARLTFVKNLSDRLALTFSLNLSQTQRQSWFLDYSFSRNLAVRAFKTDDGSFGGSFRHAFSPWGKPARAAGGEKTVSRIEVEVEGGGGARLDRKLLERAWKPLRVGRPFRMSDLGLALENLNRLYRKNGYANAVVTTPLLGSRARDEGAGTETAVVFRLKPGEPAVLDFRGDGIRAGLKEKVRTAWTGHLPEASNLDAAREIILRELMRKRYYRAEVKAEAFRSGGRTTYAITVAKNGRYRVRDVKVDGAAAVADSVVRKAAAEFPSAESRRSWNIITSPRAALRSVKRAYDERGYTKAVIEVRRIEEDKERRTLDIVIGVEEGPRSMVRSVAFDGNRRIATEELMGALTLDEGSPYDPAKLAEDRNALLNLYRGKGYQDVEIAGSPTTVEKEGDGTVGVAIVYGIGEGSRHEISSIEVSGDARTGDEFILRASGLRPGQALTSEGLALGQKRLYDTRIFQSVSLESEPEKEAGKEPEPANSGPVLEKVRIEVREMPFLTVAYGLRYDSEEKFGGFGELDFRSLFGEGRAGLFAFRRTAIKSDLRFSLESNSLFGLRFNLLSTVYTKRDIRELFTADETGLTLQSRIATSSKFDLSALYRMNKIHTFSPDGVEPSPLESSVFLSEIGGLMVRDTRDDLLDPTRGTFFSLALTWSPTFLATEFPYISAFGQFQSYLRFGPGLVWAAAVRVGAAEAFGRDLVAAKRFFTGGGSSIRGFKQDGVGPIDPLSGAPAGGAVVFVLNQELRFPLFGPASGVIFYDAGNVFSTLRNVRIGDMRHGLGLGLRVRSPIGLIRADYGFNLRPLPGEKRGILFLSIGQAF